MTATTTYPAPRSRVRVNLKRTAKEGWQPADDTVEFEWDGTADDMQAAELGKLMRYAYTQARVEARRRNEIEAKPAA